MEGCAPPPGLPNFGNTCYLNSALQSIAACHCAAQWIISAAAAVHLHSAAQSRKCGQSEGCGEVRGLAAHTAFGNVVQLIARLFTTPAALGVACPILHALAPLMRALSQPARPDILSSWSSLGTHCKRLLRALQQSGVLDVMGEQEDSLEALEGMCQGAASEVQRKQHLSPQPLPHTHEDTPKKHPRTRMPPHAGLLTLLHPLPASAVAFSNTLPVMVGFEGGGQAHGSRAVGERGDEESIACTEEGDSTKGASSRAAVLPPLQNLRHPPLRGVLLTCNVCDVCDGCMGVNHVPFLTLPLPVPCAVKHPGVATVQSRGQKETTLQHCMQAFVAPQALEGLICARCTLRKAAAAAAAAAAEGAPAGAQAASPSTQRFTPSCLMQSGAACGDASSCCGTRHRAAIHHPALECAQKHSPWPLHGPWLNSTPASRAAAGAATPQDNNTERCSIPRRMAHIGLCARDAALAAARTPACVPLPDLGDLELDEMLEALAQADVHDSGALAQADARTLHSQAEAIWLASGGVSCLDGAEAPPQVQHEECKQLGFEAGNGAQPQVRREECHQLGHEAGAGAWPQVQHGECHEHGHEAQATFSLRKEGEPQRQRHLGHSQQAQTARAQQMRVRQPAVQHTSVGCLPPVLVLQLQRSRWDASCLTGPLKVQGHIRFPLELKPADLQVLQPPYLPRSLQQAAAAPDLGHPHLDDHVSFGPPGGTTAAEFCGCNKSGDVVKQSGSLNTDAVACSCPDMSHGLGFQADGKLMDAASRDGAPMDKTYTDAEAGPNQPLHSMRKNYSCCCYSLQAVMVHLGSGRGGHWLTYRRGIAQNYDGAACTSPLASQWFRMSDCSVTAVSEEEVLASHACALVYQKQCLHASKDSTQG